MGMLSGRHGVRRRWRRTKWMLGAMMGGLLLIGSTLGAFTAEATIDGILLSETEKGWLKDNPALAEIAATAPEALREILDKLADAVANPSTGRGGLHEVDEETARVLKENPALLEAWRSSPEASADLLQLIRIAAGGDKPRK
jgi:hypothetical protein